MANYQKKVYYVTQEIYNILWNDGAKDGSYTHNGVTYTYDEDATYYVQDRGEGVDLSNYATIDYVNEVLGALESMLAEI